MSPDIDGRASSPQITSSLSAIRGVRCDRIGVGTMWSPESYAAVDCSFQPCPPYRREYLSMADRPSSGDRLKLFISYSRRDMAAADALVTALDGEGFEITIDRRDLPLRLRLD